jgi:hypothetical protein
MWGAIESSTDVSMLHHIVTEKVFLTVVVEVEQLRHVLGGTSRVARIGESSAGVSQFIEEGVDHGFNGGQTLCRRVLEELGDKINGTWVGLAEDLWTCK